MLIRQTEVDLTASSRGSPRPNVESEQRAASGPVRQGLQEPQAPPGCPAIAKR